MATVCQDWLIVGIDKNGRYHLTHSVFTTSFLRLSNMNSILMCCTNMLNLRAHNVVISFRAEMECEGYEVCISIALLHKYLAPQGPQRSQTYSCVDELARFFSFLLLSSPLSALP
jgi:hypothetical protein